MKNICIVGCGAIAASHAKKLIGRCRLYFHNRSNKSAERFAAKFNGKGIFQTFEEAANNPSIEGLVICSPPEFHKDQVIAGLSQGKTVLTEKPLCLSVQELAAIETALKENPTAKLMVAENYYYKPSTLKLKELISSGRIGKIQSLSIKKVRQQRSHGWKEKHGALLEGGIHFIALISSLLDKAPIGGRAEFPNVTEYKPERTSQLTLYYDEGIQVTLLYSWETKSLTQGIFQHSVIQGDKGKIVFESNGLYILLKEEKCWVPVFPNLSDIQGSQAMIDDFVRCLKEPGHQPLSDLAKAKRDLDIVFRAYTMTASQ